MFKISDIMEKEIVNINNGRKLGFIGDIEIDTNDGTIKSLVVYNDNSKLYLLGRSEMYSISWKNIVKIGCDTILVDYKDSNIINEVDI
ncbi:sporulation protein, YlmC/YmxH family [Alkalithermobacter thermoalcaliphilus JW-YL-7 = DSM 7308]|uniref:Sporulation protein, YlmC/YmxH family n=1 Tax=Alkalithermobacter thermoalcaliphilus JW-YL-7 = DSM 7308 TaxID=1121328 RepID=A0A150FR91_CLOPD|nr:sporulation protein, YlmC/YmxH family [[Clostridium] paradoxum JW-YL-7 = DSM 7308]SHK98024.1 sporulation protein, YlmC/YmxH family [[Clostridium] paradoxum JW-YL-7 = DSM 7308]